MFNFLHITVLFYYQNDIARTSQPEMDFRWEGFDTLPIQASQLSGLDGHGFFSFFFFTLLISFIRKALYKYRGTKLKGKTYEIFLTIL